MAEKPVTHGIEHRPSGYDPAQTDPWTYVSNGGTAWSSLTTYSPDDEVENGAFIYTCISRNTDVEPGTNTQWARYWRISAPVFQNGWANTGGTLTQMRYRLSVGPPHVLDKDNGSIVDVSAHQVEIQGSCSGGADGTTVFTLPPAYAPDSDLRMSATDDTGLFVVIQVLATGDVVRGL